MQRPMHQNHTLSPADRFQKACVGKRLNQVSRFGCTDNNRLFKDAPAVACLCSEAGLESVIASCMQTVCPQDQEGILGISAFLDKFCYVCPFPKLHEPPSLILD